MTIVKCNAGVGDCRCTNGKADWCLRENELEPETQEATAGETTKNQAGFQVGKYYRTGSGVLVKVTGFGSESTKNAIIGTRYSHGQPGLPDTWFSSKGHYGEEQDDYPRSNLSPFEVSPTAEEIAEFNLADESPVASRVQQVTTAVKLCLPKYDPNNPDEFASVLSEMIVGNNLDK